MEKTFCFEYLGESGDVIEKYNACSLFQEGNFFRGVSFLGDFEGKKAGAGAPDLKLSKSKNGYSQFLVAEQ